MQQRLDRNDTFIKRWSRCLKWNLPQHKVYISKTTTWFPFPWLSVTKHYKWFSSYIDVSVSSIAFCRCSSKGIRSFLKYMGEKRNTVIQAILTFVMLLYHSLTWCGKEILIWIVQLLSRMFLEIHIGAISLFWPFRDLFLTMQLVVMISDIDDVIVVKMRFALEAVD